jgi:histidine triad (HIT) family protein
MATDPTCIFCKIVAGQVPAAKVLDTNTTLAFLDINPVAPGHVLLVPKEHSATIADSAPECIAATAAELPRLSRAVLRATGASALNIVQNNGRDAGQLIDHVHFHLIPRSPGDAFHIPWPKGRYEGGTLEEMRARIQAAL